MKSGTTRTRGQTRSLGSGDSSDHGNPRLPAHKITGLLLIVMALVCNQWVMGALFAPSGSINEFPAIVFLWFFQAVLFIVGGTIFRSGGTAQGRKNLCFALILLIFGVVSSEISLQVLSAGLEFAKPEEAKIKQLDSRLMLSPYAGKDWAVPLFGELEKASKQQYESFYLWRRAEFEGDFVNINAEGVRKTWNPESRPEVTPREIFVLGGSTAWGTGVRDDYTIPSCLSRELYENGYAYNVRNFGETGYTLTQELVRLIMLLRHGKKPDLVVFYDGVNEVYAGYKTATPGKDIRYGVFRKLMANLVPEPLSLRQDVYLATTGLLDRHCVIYQTLAKIPLYANALSSRIEGAAVQQNGGTATGKVFTEEGASIDAEALDALAEGISDSYVSTAAVIERLAEAYNFDYVMFWQPVLFEESRLSEEEASSVRFNDRSLGYLYQQTYADVRTCKIENWFDISDALGGRSNTLYIDFCHVAEEGNRMIAKRMYSELASSGFLVDDTSH